MDRNKCRIEFIKKEKREQGHFIRYDYTVNLPNNTVHGIINDNKGNIWVSTNKGIAKINKGNNQITAYYQRNGLQNNEFSDGAYYKSKFNNYIFSEEYPDLIISIRSKFL